MTCSELGVAVDGLQNELMQKFSASECSAPRTDALDTFNCSSLSTLELKLKKLQNERALLEGIQKLKERVRERRAQIVTSRANRVTQRAALGFADAVVVAQSLEVFANTQIGDHNILADLKTAMAVTPAPDFTTAKNTICAERPEAERTQGACGPEFRPNENAITEITAILAANEITPALLTNWRTAIKIAEVSVDGAAARDYTFTDMRREISDSLGNIPTSFSVQQIKDLQGLPDFQNFQGSDIVVDIRNGKANAITRDQFKFLTEDLTARLHAEVKAQVSTVYAAYMADLNPAPAGVDCPAAKTDYVSATSCIAELRAGMAGMTNPNKKAEVGRFIASAENSNLYLTNISQSSGRCLQAIDASFISTTESTIPDCSGMVTREAAAIQADIDRVNALKAKIEEENANLIAFRDYAVQRLLQDRGTNSCHSVTQTTTLGTCDDQYSSTHIPAAISSLSSNVMNISMILTQLPAAGTAPEMPACPVATPANPQGVNNHIARLCASREEEGSDEPVAVTPEPSRRQYREVEERHPFWEGIAAGAPYLANTIAQANMARMYPPQNPYTLYPSLYGGYGGLNSLSYSNNLLYPGMATGAFTYQPTIGLPLYTSMIPGMTSYTPAPVTTGSSSYFNFQY